VHDAAPSAVPDRAALRAVLPRALSLAAAVGVFGVSFGVLAADAGLSPAQAQALSLFVFTGSAQYAAVSAIAAGATIPAVVAVALLLNTRCLPFGLALAPLLGRGPAARALGAHLVIDESTALALAEREPVRARAAFWVTGLSVFAFWNANTLAGVLAGDALGDPGRLGLDAVFPAAFVALLAPLVRSRPAAVAALAGAAIALLLVPAAPAGIPVTASALGALAGLLVTRRAGGRTG